MAAKANFTKHTRGSNLINLMDCELRFGVAVAEGHCRHTLRAHRLHESFAQNREVDSASLLAKCLMNY